MRRPRHTRWSQHPGLVRFYRAHRRSPEELYASERRFLPWLASGATTVLDVGCAAGGFQAIWEHYRRGIQYTGVDVSAALIESARRAHPDARFYLGDCAEGLPLPDRSASVVQALGWLHWEPRYRRALAELWRVTDRYLFFDVRLSSRLDRLLRGTQRLAFEDPWDGRTSTPYLVLPWARFARGLLELRPSAIFGYGYWGHPADTVRGVDGRIGFATFVLERAPRGQAPQVPLVCIDLPWAWPSALSARVLRMPGSQLDGVLERVGLAKLRIPRRRIPRARGAPPRRRGHGLDRGCGVSPGMGCCNGNRGLARRAPQEVEA